MFHYQLVWQEKFLIDLMINKYYDNLIKNGKTF